MKKFMFAVCAIMLVCSMSLSAAEYPVSFNLWEGIQGPGGPESSVKGVRFNVLYGVNENLTGLDFGLFFPVNIVKNEMKGVQLGLFNSVKTGTGIQWGFVNYSSADFVGWQNAFVNVSKGNFTGFQSAAINVADNFKGLQLAFINYTKTLNGLQIGFVNVNAQGQPLNYPFLALPIVNFNF